MVMLMVFVRSFVCYVTFIDFYSTFIIAANIYLYCRCVLSFLPINEYDDDDDDDDDTGIIKAAIGPG